MAMRKADEARANRGRIREWPLTAWLWLCLAVVAVLVTVTLAHRYRFAFNSDDAIHSVLARLAVADGTLLPRNWIFVNGDLWIASAYPFSVLLYPWLGLGYSPNVLAAWLAALLLALTVFGACLLIAPRLWRAALLATVLSSAGITAVNFEYVIGQGAYSLYAALALCLFGLAARPPPAVSRAPVTCLLAFAAAVLVCLSNALRGNVTIMLPLLIGWLIAALVTPVAELKQRARRLRDPLIFAIVAGALVGTLLYHLWLRARVLNFDAVTGHGVAPLAQMWQHLARLPAAWFLYFMIDRAWSSLGVPARFLQAGAWALAVAVLAVPLWTVVMPQQQNAAVVRFAWIVIAAFAVSFAALVASPILLEGASSLRYATFPVYGSICLIAIAAERFAREHRRAGGIMVFALALLAVATAASWRWHYTPHTWDGDGTYAQRMALLRSLEADRVGTVLSPYWNSHVLTVLSDDAVDGYPVYLADPGPLLKPYVHHMPRRVFHGQAGSRQAVVGAFGNSGSSAFWTAAQYQLGEPAKRISAGGFMVWVYDRDIATAILATGHELDAAVPAAQLSVTLSPTQFSRCLDGRACQVWTDLTDTGAHELTSVGALPLRLGIQAIDANGKLLHDAGRVDFPVLIAAGGTHRISVPLPATDDPQVAGYRLCLMQEHVAWLCGRTFAGAGSR